ncbi:MAG TPA: MerR family transcriptional regulator, partial [Candidatus Limiplasma sp.]|nr:MerR family transcriptional regulator [Candidatus Limiplasma sp.]
NFQDWEKLICWVEAQEDYQFAGDWNDQDHMCGLLEENLNYLTHLKEGNSEPEGMQLDLLLPLRRA